MKGAGKIWRKKLRLVERNKTEAWQQCVKLCHIQLWGCILLLQEDDGNSPHLQMVAKLFSDQEIPQKVV